MLRSSSMLQIKSRATLKQLTNVLSKAEEKHFVTCLAEILSLEKDIEVIKINLSLRFDFTLTEAIKFLDEKRKCILTRVDFRKFLENHKLFLSEEDLHLIFAKLSSDGVNLTYNELNDGLLPSDHYYGNLLIAKRLQFKKETGEGEEDLCEQTQEFLV